MSLQRKPAVMVVDDDHSTVETFVEFLELNDVKTIGKAYDGKSAVDLFLKLRPDIVFLDVMMPEHDGIYALEMIRGIDPNVTIIMLTGDLTKETETKLKAFNATNIIYKPFDVDKIIEIINKVKLKE